MAVVLLQLLEQEGLAVAVLVGLGQQTERLVQPTEAVVVVARVAAQVVRVVQEL